MAINVQQLITGYGIGFSAPCLAQLVSGAFIVAGVFLSICVGGLQTPWNKKAGTMKMV